MRHFVVFEGVEGSGKSTQSRALNRRLQKAGLPTVLTHEPGGTPIGEQIRRSVKSRRQITPLTELFLFSAARAALVESVIGPALATGKIVVSDRYVYSTLAYQGYGRGLELDMIGDLNDIATKGLLPDLVVLLDLPAPVGLSRKSELRLDRIEGERTDFHRRVRQGYLDLARREPGRWLVLDATESRASLARSVWCRVSKLIAE